MFTVESLYRYMYALITDTRYAIWHFFLTGVFGLNCVMACAVAMLLQASTVGPCSCVDNQWFVKLPFCPGSLEKKRDARSGFYLVFCSFVMFALVIMAISCCGFFFFLYLAPFICAS